MFFLLSLVEQPKLTPPIANEIVVAQNHRASDLALPTVSQKSQDNSSGRDVLRSKELQKTSSEIEHSELQLSRKRQETKRNNYRANPGLPIAPSISIVAQEREGEQRIFEIPVEGEETETETETQPIPIDTVDVVEVIADRQEYDRDTQVITAEGNVVMRFAEAIAQISI